MPHAPWRHCHPSLTLIALSISTYHFVFTTYGYTTMGNNRIYDITTLGPDAAGENRTHDRISTIAVSLGAVVFAASVGAGIHAVGDTAKKPKHADACTDGGHQLVDIDEQSTWSAYADEFSSDSSAFGRAYDISPASLALANSSITIYKDGNPVNDIAYTGEACLTLPGPDVPGIIRVDGRTSVTEYADKNYKSISELKKLNPGIKNGSQILSEGQVLKIAAKPDMSLFKRNMAEPDLRAVVAVVHPNDLAKQKALSDKIKADNPDIFDDGRALVRGEVAYLPPKKPGVAGVTVAKIIAEYGPTYAQLGENQQITPQETKPVISQIDISQLAVLQLELFGVPKEYAAMYVKYGAKYKVSPKLLAAMGKQESGWQQNPGVSSAGALGIAQFMPGTWKEWKERLHFPAKASPLIPRYAIEAQAAMMQDLQKQVQPYTGKHNKEQLALAAYNLGLGRVQYFRGMPPPDEIGNYVVNIESMKSVMDRYLARRKTTNALHETSTGQTVPERIGRTVYFSQTDNRWTWEPYNTGTNPSFNIGANGCAPTAQAIVLSTLTGRNFNPLDMATYNMIHGFVVPDAKSGGSWGDAAMRQSASDFGLHWKNLPKSFEAVKAIIDKGGLVEVNGQDDDDSTPATPGGHVYVIRDYTKDGKFMIADPASIANSRRAWDPQEIFGPASFVIGVTK